MNDKKRDIDRVEKSILKILEDKEVVRSYLKGEISSRKVASKGVKLGKPL